MQTNLRPFTVSNDHVESNFYSRTTEDKQSEASFTTAKDTKKTVEELREEWKKLWKERFDDKQKAEGVAVADYSKLFVERGTIVHATRDFKVLNFKEILDKNQVNNPDRFVEPPPEVGGWGKFIKTDITSQRSRRARRAESYVAPKKEVQQSKKGGRGWLHK